MQATLEAALVSRIARSGAVPDAVVDGPFALDNAISVEAAALKGRTGEVAGRADILVVPEIETGNVLYKSLQTFCGTTYASVVVGTDKPVAVPSRVDSPESMLASIALACVLSG
jgi:phosphate butyryltransferase